MIIMIKGVLAISIVFFVFMGLITCNYSEPNDCRISKSRSKKYLIYVLIDRSIIITTEEQFLKENPGCMRLVISRMLNDTCLIEVIKKSDTLGQHEREEYIITPDLSKFYTEIIIKNRNRIISISYSFSGVPAFTYVSGLNEKYWNIQTYYGFASNQSEDLILKRAYYDSNTVNLRFMITGFIHEN